MTLRAKVLVQILLVSGLLVGWLFGAWMPAQLRAQEAALRESAQSHLASLAESFVPFLLGQQLDAIYGNLDRLKERNASWRAIELAAPDGRILYPLAPPGGPLTAGVDELVVHQAISIQDVELGRLTARVDLRPELAGLRQRHRQLLVAALLVVIAYTGLLWFTLDRSVRRPLQMLAGASKRLAAGEYDTPLERAGVAEVVALVDAFSTMRESIRQYQAEISEAQKMEALGTLAGGIAHDFNNILSPIIGYTDLARSAARNDPELAEDLAEVSKAALRARDLVHQILTFCRRAARQKVPLRLADVVQEALKLLRPSLPSTIEFRQQLAAPGPMIGDPSQIHQVIMNLFTNAFHAMEASGGVLAVAVEEVEVPPERVLGAELRPGRYAVLSVSDTGVGMEKEVLKRIFDPYFTTKARGKGTGLGLAVVDGIVRDHDGCVRVYSEPGKGSTFKVYFPLAAEAPAAPRADARLEPSAPAGGNERVLVVDDEVAIRNMLGKWLGDAGYRAVVVEDSAAALVRLERDPGGWDLLITDMTMPGMDGRELARRAMALRPDLPVILCCGYSALINGDQAARMGIRAYLEKPVMRLDLLRSVRRALDRPPPAGP